MQTAETALVILVPEAEELVKSYRNKYDPSSANGMPAHITLLYPFLKIEEISAIKLTSLAKLFKAHVQLGFSLTATAQFPGVLYLKPEPAEAFKSLILAVCGYSPETLPYGGEYSDLVPHLTVANIANQTELSEVADEFSARAASSLPIHSMVDEVVLMENSSGRWHKHTTFRLGDEPVLETGT